MSKQKVAIIFGGRSAEHEVSVRSARNIYEALDKSKYDISLIGITKRGEWLPLPSEKQLLQNPAVHADEENGIVIPAQAGIRSLVSSRMMDDLSSVNVVFPVLHGPYGEDGTIQGMLRLMNLPVVGAGVLGSAIGMDKDVMKRLLRDAGIQVAKFEVLHKHSVVSTTERRRNPTGISLSVRDDKLFEDVTKSLGLPLFIKPANLGSSVGVSKVTNEEEFMKAVNLAFQYDTKILIEEAIKGREIELSVLGNDNPIVSGAGEILAAREFYDYDAKYIDENGTKIEIPAKIDDESLKLMQEVAKQAFITLCTSGMARVDCFLTEDGRVYMNEINTIPGFTNISMYPKLWEAAGISYSELVDRLIELAIEKFEEEKTLKTDKQ